MLNRGNPVIKIKNHIILGMDIADPKMASDLLAAPKVPHAAYPEGTQGETAVLSRAITNLKNHF
jgi:hypothetical protein